MRTPRWRERSIVSVVIILLALEAAAFQRAAGALAWLEGRQPEILIRASVTTGRALARAGGRALERAAAPAVKALVPAFLAALEASRGVERLRVVAAPGPGNRCPVTAAVRRHSRHVRRAPGI